MDAAQRRRANAYIRAHKAKMPDLVNRADEADVSWQARVAATLPDAMQIVDFRELYDLVYDQYATYDHASTVGLSLFVHSDVNGATVDGFADRDATQNLRPYWLALFAFGEALIISSLASGHPRLEPLRAALQQIVTLRDFDRRGTLAVTQTEAGVTIGLEDDSEP